MISNWFPVIRRTLSNGKALTAQVAPYSRGMPQLVVDVGEAQDKGFPIISERVTLTVGASDLGSDEALVAALEGAVDKVAATVGWVACVECGTERLDVTQTNRYVQIKTKKKRRMDDGDIDIYACCDKTRPLCEECFLKALEASWKEDAAKTKAREAKEEAKLARKGYTHKTVAWVHPKAGGDDYDVVVYSKGEMDAAQIQGLLRRRGSSRLDDWRQTPIGTMEADG